MFAHSRFLLLLTAVVILSLAACGGSSTPSNSSNSPTTASPAATATRQATVTRQPTVTEQPTVTREPTVAVQATPTTNSGGTSEAGSILFQDDFSDPKSGWVATKTDYGEFAYDNGTFLYAVDKPNFITHALLPAHNFDNTSIEADVALDKGGKNAPLGLICRASANTTQMQTGYKFLVVPGAGYGILEQTGQNAADFKPLVEKDQADAIPTSGTIHLRADCAGDHLALYADGKELTEATSSDLKSGQIGFALASPIDQGVTVRFDNLVVREAAP